MIHELYLIFKNYISISQLSFRRGKEEGREKGRRGEERKEREKGERERERKKSERERERS
jgi:hypothetical protein